MRKPVQPILIGALMLMGPGLLSALAAEHRTFDEITPEALALRQAEARQFLEAQRQWAVDVGLSVQEVGAILRAKGEMHQLQERLLAEAGSLSTVLQTREASDQQAAEAVKRYTDLRNWTLSEMQKIQDDLVARLGAADKPRVLGALIVMGAIDNGTRLLCGVHNGVVGGTPANVIDPESRRRIKLVPDP